MDNLADRLHGTDGQKNTPLHVAAFYKCWELVVLFAIVDIRLNDTLLIANNDGQTPMDLARETSDLFIPQFLTRYAQQKTF